MLIPFIVSKIIKALKPPKLSLMWVSYNYWHLLYQKLKQKSIGINLLKKLINITYFYEKSNRIFQNKNLEKRVALF